MRNDLVRNDADRHPLLLVQGGYELGRSGGEGYQRAYGRIKGYLPLRPSTVLAARVGGVPEIIEDGKTGWLFPQQDWSSAAGVLGCAEAGGVAGPVSM